MNSKLKYGFLIEHMTPEEKASLMSGAHIGREAAAERRLRRQQRGVL